MDLFYIDDTSVSRGFPVKRVGDAWFVEITSKTRIVLDPAFAKDYRRHQQVFDGQRLFQALYKRNETEGASSRRLPGILKPDSSYRSTDDEILVLWKIPVLVGEVSELTQDLLANNVTVLVERKTNLYRYLLLELRTPTSLDIVKRVPRKPDNIHQLVWVNIIPEVYQGTPDEIHEMNREIEVTLLTLEGDVVAARWQY